MPSLSVWNIWDLPVWAWRSYAAFHDNHVEQQRAAAEQEGRRGHS